MREWPPISSPDVVAWMALDDDEWLRAVMAREGEVEMPPFTEAAYQFGLAYPWGRPARSSWTPYPIQGWKQPRPMG